MTLLLAILLLGAVLGLVSAGLALYRRSQPPTYEILDAPPKVITDLRELRK